MDSSPRPYDLLIEHDPLKYLERLRRKDAAGIDRDLNELARDPLKKAGVVAMKGQSQRRVQDEVWEISGYL